MSDMIKKTFSIEISKDNKLYCKMKFFEFIFNRKISLRKPSYRVYIVPNIALAKKNRTWERKQKM